MPKTLPRVTTAFLADNHRESDGKVDCLGLIAGVGIWAVPAAREYSLAIGFADLPGGRSEYTVWLRRGRQRAGQLADGYVETKAPLSAAIGAVRVALKLNATGRYEIGVRVGQRRTFWVPFGVALRPWPKLPKGKALERALADPHTIKTGRVQIECKKCGAKYVFEVKLNPNAELAEDARPFPETGELRCRECRTLHHLKDIEGQTRAQLGKQFQPTERSG